MLAVQHGPNDEDVSIFSKLSQWRICLGEIVLKLTIAADSDGIIRQVHVEDEGVQYVGRDAFSHNGRYDAYIGRHLVRRTEADKDDSCVYTFNSWFSTAQKEGNKDAKVS